MPATPFTAPTYITCPLYGWATRVPQGTSAVHASKVCGAAAADTIVDLAARAATLPRVVGDIGCGRGTSTLHLATALRPRRLIALDRSQPLLDIAASRVRDAGHVVIPVAADFHSLPLAEECLDLAVAAFCHYHSPRPQTVLAEINRSLAPGGRAVLATKSADSYAELDDVIASIELDPHATARPSLYQAFHSGNAADIVAETLLVEDVVHQRHEFCFDSPDALASYVATSPKYSMSQIFRDTSRLAAQLRRLPHWPVLATSTVTYVLARTP
ncbi:class I SAM-dependent methyltransferase, partial [Nocardia abscessus]|uniref:class I SAM-dependent methyltransferase n=1 Tax=Nocardia abscessus TaxID=120957 RepID=UPI0024553F18